MGVEPFLVASSLNVVIAQRLVRTNCSACLEEYSPTADALKAACLNSTEGAIFQRGRGCDACGNTGFRGRIGLFEILEVSPEIAKLIMGRVSRAEIYEKAREQGFTNITEDGISKALKGMTTIEEVLKYVA
ncbi:MAG: hypothetical protein GTO08_02975 [Deltaproteobacteria bacterium]|nr:hypothetical protein [Deltaproteobacteria bacterium]